MLKIRLFLSVLLAFTVKRGLMLWFILEVNFLCFIGILRQNLSIANPNRNIYYFLVQSLGRAFMLISLIFNRLIKIGVFDLFFIFALVLKLGGAPFHYWYLKLVQMLNWWLIWLLSIWQKLIPLLLLTIIKIDYFLIFGGLRITIGRIRTWKQKKLKKILGLSSIFSLGWIFLSLIVRERIWLMFIVGYGLSLLILIMVLFKINYSISNKIDNSINPLFLLIFLLGLLFLRGIPPFIGFFLKFLILRILMQVHFWMSMFMLIIRLHLIFVYLIMAFLTLTYVKFFNIFNIAQYISVFRELIISNIFITIFISNASFCILIHK